MEKIGGKEPCQQFGPVAPLWEVAPLPHLAVKLNEIDTLDSKLLATIVPPGPAGFLKQAWARMAYMRPATIPTMLIMLPRPRFCPSSKLLQRGGMRCSNLVVSLLRAFELCASVIGA
eukprot:1160801-Pelagomonas_calceolata.AAC.5